jgi:hypothetical protein
MKLRTAMVVLLGLSDVACSGMVTSMLSDASKTDMRGYMGAAAQRFGAGADASRCSAPVDEPDADQVVWSNTSKTAVVYHVAMDTVGVNQNARVPAQRSIAAYGPDCRRRWLAERSPDSKERIVSASPVVLIERASEKGAVLEALSLTDGRTLWNRSLTGESNLRIQDILGVAAIASTQSLDLVELATGRGRASARLEGNVPAVPLFRGEDVLAWSSSLSSYSLQDGSQLWSQASEGVGRALPAAVGSDLVVAGGKGLSWLGEQGVRWRQALPGVLSNVRADEQRVLVELASPPSLVVLDAASGAQLWQMRQTTPFSSAELLDELVLHTTREKIVVHRASDGAAVASHAIPGSGSEQRLPDRIVRFENTAVVVGEEGLAGVDLATGRMLWAMHIPFARETTLAEQLTQFRATALYWAPESLDQLTQLASEAREQWHDGALRAHAYAAFAQRFSPGNGYGLLADTALSLSEPLRALGGGGGTGAAMELAQVSMGFYAAAAEQAAAELRAAGMRRGAARLEQALSLYQASIQHGRYFVRPLMGARTQGVLVVDLLKGTWREVLTGPAEPMLRDNFMQFPPATVNPEGTTLMALGPGWDSAHWEATEHYLGLTTVKRQLFAYDLAPATFKPAGEYAKRSRIR